MEYWWIKGLGTLNSERQFNADRNYEIEIVLIQTGKPALNKNGD